MAKGKKGASCKMTMDLYRKWGYHVWKTEVWNSFAGKRLDLFNFIDVLAIDEHVTIGVQDTTTRAQMMTRRRKILGLPHAWDWLQEPHRIIEVIGHTKPGSEWEHDIIEITLEDFTDGRPEQSS